MKLRIVTLIVLFSAVRGFCDRQIPQAGYLSDFETIWKKVDETFFDPSFGGVDWPGAHDRFRPQIATAKTDGEFHALINKMLW